MQNSAAATMADGQPRTWRRRLSGPLAAGLLLAAFWAFLVSSVVHKSLTSDETAHAAAGYTYWRFNDYRLNPENGNLPQRVMGLGLLIAHTRFPSIDSDAWRTSNEWSIGDAWFHHEGNNVASMLLHGRAAMALLAAALGALVWACSRRLFGPLGGMLSLVLFVLSPIVLANGALMTSDTCAALFFLAAVWSLWRLMQRISPGRVLCAGLCAGGLFASKMSAPLIVPMVLALMIVRLIDGRALPFGEREIRERGHLALALAGIGFAQVAIVWATLWGFYGFRYEAFAPGAGPGQFTERWEVVLKRPDPLSLISRLDLDAGQKAGVMRILQARHVPLEIWRPERLEALAAIRHDVLTAAQARLLDSILAAPPLSAADRLVDLLRRRRLLPEAYIYGQVYALKYSQARASFLNGESSIYGWRWFFPYAFLVKTPLTVFGVCGLALAAAFRRRPLLPGLYETAPLWTLIAIYWAAVLNSHLNIGHRHILAVHPPLFILCGAAACWIGEPGRTARRLALALGLLIAALAAEVAYRYPNYLAYFNVLAGGPRQGYRHLVDSSLDWGQDLPGLKAYIARNNPKGPVYLSYFGTGSPSYYGIPARRLYSFPGGDILPALRMTNVPVARLRAAVEEELAKDPDYSVVGSAAPQGGQLPVLFLKNPGALRLQAGTYFISASMLQPLLYDTTGPLGPWNTRYEAIYQRLSEVVRPLMSVDPVTRENALGRRTPQDWYATLTRFEMFRFARLTAYLRQRKPDDTVNYSILVYHLGEADLARALDGPPPELGLDLLRDMPLAPKQ